MFKPPTERQLARWEKNPRMAIKLGTRKTSGLVRALRGFSTEKEIRRSEIEDRRMTEFMRTQLQKTVSKYGKTALERLQLWISITAANYKALRYPNPDGHWYWLKAVLVAFSRVLRDERSTLRSGTLLVKEWETHDHEWKINLKRMRRQIRTRLKGVDYVGQIDFQLDKSEIGKLGTKYKRVRPHFHFIAFGSKAQGELTSRSDELGTVRKGRPALLVKELEKTPLVSVLYCFKGMSYQYWWSRRVRLNLKEEFRRLTALHQITFPDLAVAGGRGQDVLEQALHAVKIPQPQKRRGPKKGSKQAAAK